MLTKSLICIAGLPCAGSTVLCQLLGQHPKLYSPRYSSPLCQALLGLRQSLSNTPLLLSQINLNRANVHQQLLSAYQGLINGWFAEVQQDWVIDQNWAWMHHLELLHLIDPNFRLLVCVREPGQIWGAIEAQHQKTLLLDVPHHLADLTPIERADRLFASEGLIGRPIRSLEAIQDRAAELQSRLYYVVYEHLVSDPQDALQGIYEWLGLPPVEIDDQLFRTQAEAVNSGGDRFYQIRPTLELPPPHPVPPRITALLHQNFRWFYELFYPGLLGV